MGIRVTYLYSACVVIETADLRVLCDPWFTDGIYDGSWYQFPKLEDPAARIGRVDYVYVSHIHPDHYDPAFLRPFLAAQPEAELLIADFPANHLLKKMAADGFAPRVTTELVKGETSLHLLPNGSEDAGDPLDIDSALVVRRDGHAVVNMNDNPFNEEQVAAIRALAPQPDIALLGYTGAGPYPQTYHDDPETLERLAAEKKEQFFGRYRRMRDALRPRRTVPFAGKYVLGGDRVHLNRYRGVADAVEVARFDPDAIVLEDGGEAFLDTADLQPSAVRTEPYGDAELQARLDAIRALPMDHQRYLGGIPLEALPVLRLAPKAYRTAIERSTCTVDHYFCIAYDGRWICFNGNRSERFYEVRTEVEGLEPRSELRLDPRYLFGLLTCVFHWNNAEVGSQYEVRRVPDHFDRRAQGVLNFFHV